MEKFNLVDENCWYRKEYFNHFFNLVPCTYSITANIDISKLHSFAKEKKLKIYPLLIIAATTAINSVKEFRFAHNDKGELGYFESSHPSYTIPNSFEDTFSGIWTYALKDNKVFYESIIADIDTYKSASTYAPKANQPKNTFYISCTPDISFTSLNLTLHSGAKTLTPMLTFGKFFSDEKKLLMPLAINVHHAVCDGHHSALFFKSFQNAVDSIVI